MRCRKARRLIFEAVDGSLPENMRARLEAHLAECTGCETLASKLQESIEILRNLPPVEPGEDFNWKVKMKIARERNSLKESLASSRAAVRGWSIRFALGGAVAFVAVVLAGYLFMEAGMFESLFPSRSGDSIAAEHPYEGRTARRGKTPSGFDTNGFLPAAVRETPVAQGWYGERSSGYSFQAFDGVDQPVLTDPDSLIAVKLRDMRLRHRVRYLERQIDILQEYLRRCQFESD